MKKAITIILVLTLIMGSVAAMAQQQQTPQPQTPQPQTGPMMMCPCMMMMQQQMTPEQKKQMQERMAQWQQTCPMWKTMGTQQPQAQPKQK